MTFSLTVQALVDAMRKELGIPPCKLTINMDERGAVQTIQPLVTYTRPKWNMRDDAAEGIDKLG